MLRNYLDQHEGLQSVEGGAPLAPTLLVLRVMMFIAERNIDSPSGLE